MAVTPLAELQRQQRSGVKSLGALQEEQRTEVENGFRDPVLGSLMRVQIPDPPGSKRGQLRDAIMRKFHAGQDPDEVFGPGDALSDQYWGTVVDRVGKMDSAGKVQSFYQVELGFSPEMAVGRTDAITESLFGKPLHYDDVLSRIKDYYRDGQVQVQLADLGLEVLMGRDTPATWKEIDRLRKLQRRHYPGENDPWWFPFATSTAEQLPLMGQTIKAAPLGATAGALGGLISGVGISVASPTIGEESMIPSMVWGGVKLGASLAGAYRVGQLEAGGSILDMLGAGVDPAIAKAASFGVGVIIVALELGEISMLVKTLPGGKKLLSSLTGDVAKRLVKQKTLRDLAVSHAAKFGGYLSAETAQELAQESVSVTAEEVAKVLTERLGYGPTDPGYATIQQIKDRMIEVGTKSLESFTVLGIPGSTLSAAVDVSLLSKQNAAMRLLPDGRQTQIRVPVADVEQNADAAAAAKPAESTGKGPANGLTEDATTQRVATTNIGQAQQEAPGGGGPAAAATGPARPDADLQTQAEQVNEFVTREGQARLDAIGGPIAEAAGASWTGTPKTVKSLVDKVTRKQRRGRTDYDIYSLKDHARGTITVSSWDEVPAVLDLLREQGFAVEVTIDQPLNAFGYRGINTTTPLGDRINGEIQIHTPESWVLKKQTDDLYRKWRDDIDTVEDLQTLGPEKAAQVAADMETSRRLWADYWAAVSETERAAISSLDSGRDSTSDARETPAAGPQTPSVSTSNRDSSGLNPQTRPSGNRDRVVRSMDASVPQTGTPVKSDSGKLPGGRQAGSTILFSPEEGIRVVRQARKLFAEGADQFGIWSERMLAAAGEEIRPALQQLWDLAVDPTVEPEQVPVPQVPAAAASAVQPLDPVQIQTALEDLSYAALAEKARDIGVRVKGKKAQLAAAVAAMIKAKTARRTVARPDAGEVHPGSLTFREFNAILGRELGVADSDWIAKWSLPETPEKPKDWFRRLSSEWQGLQTLGEIPEVQQPGSVRWTDLDEQARQEIEALDQTEPDDAIRRAEKEIAYAAMFDQALQEGQQIRSLRDALYAAYRAGTAEGVARAKQAYRTMRQAIKARKEMREEMVKHLNQIKRPVGKTVAFAQRQAIEQIQAVIDPAFRSRKTVAEREASRKYFAEHPEAQAPAKVLDLIHRKSLGEMTVTEIEQLAQTVQELRRKGKILRQRENVAKAERLEEDIRDVVTSIDAPPPEGWDPEAPIVRPPEERRRDRWWNFYVSTLTPERVFDWLDRGKDYMGDVFRIFWTRVADAESAKLVKIRERTAATVEILKRLKLTYQDLQATALTLQGEELTAEMCIGAYNFMKNVSSRLAITFGNGITPASQETIRRYVEEKRPELKELADWIVERYEEHYERLRQAVIEAEDRDMGRELWYTPMRRLEADYTPDERQILDEMMSRHHFKRGYADKGMTLMRKDISPEFQQPIRLDAWSVLLEQIDRQEHYIAMAKIVKDLHAILRDDEVREALRRRGGRQTFQLLQGYVDAVGNPNIYKSYGQVERWLRRLRRNTAIAFLAWKVSTMLKQPVSMVRYLPHAGMHLLQAGLEAASDWGRVRSLVVEKDPLVEQPALERELEELKAADAKGYQELVDRVGKAGMQGIVWMDGIARTIGWYGTYLHEIAKGAGEEQAVARARLATSTSQAGARVFQLPELYRSNQDAFLLLIQFTNELNKLWNIATYDFVQAIKNSQWERAAGTFVAVGIEATLMWMLANRALPKDEEDGLEIVGDQLVGALPVLGPIIVSTAHGFGGQGIPAWEGAAQAAVTLRETALEGLRGQTDEAKILDAAHKIYKGLAPWAGVPYTGPRDIARTILHQDLGYLLGGRPKETTTSAATRRGRGRQRGRGGRRRRG